MPHVGSGGTGGVGVLYLVVALLASLLVALGWMMYFYQFDEGKRESPQRIGMALVLGALAVIPTLAWESWAARWIDERTTWGVVVSAFGVVGLGEEAFKFAAAYLAAFRFGTRVIQHPVDAILYAIASALGFAAVENALYAQTFGVEVLVLRSVIGFAVHASFAGIFGYFVGISLLRGEGVAPGAMRGVGGAAILHGLYDYAILTQLLSPGGILMAVALLYGLLSSRITAARESAA